MSRFVVARAVSENDGPTVLRVWSRDWAPILGWPRQTYSDNGSSFDSDNVRQFFASQGTRAIFGPVSHPQSTGLSETQVRLVKSQIMKWQLASGGDRDHQS